MPDMTMCVGDGCPRLNDCYRHRARPLKHGQSWFDRTPWAGSGGCKHFTPLMKGDRLRKPLDGESEATQ